jgi:hypothetical protein
MKEIVADDNRFYAEISELLQQERNTACRAVFTDFEQFYTHCVGNLNFSYKLNNL